MKEHELWAEYGPTAADKIEWVTTAKSKKHAIELFVKYLKKHHETLYKKMENNIYVR